MLNTAFFQNEVFSFPGMFTISNTFKDYFWIAEEMVHGNSVYKLLRLAKANTTILPQRRIFVLRLFYRNIASRTKHLGMFYKNVDSWAH